MSLQNPNHFWDTHTHLHCTVHKVIVSLVHSSQCPALSTTTLLHFLLYFWHLTSSSQTLSIWAGWTVVLPAETRHVSLHQNVQKGSSTHPAPTRWVPQALTPGVQQREHKVDHSPPSNARVDESSYTSTPAIGLRGADNLNFHRHQTEDSLIPQDIF